MNGTIDPDFDYVANLARDAKLDWPAISKAKHETHKKRKMLEQKLRHFISTDVDIVVFGSLARQEWTSGSDVDWTMLIDGQSSPEHRLISQKIQSKLSDIGLAGPGAEGIFGNFAFSHDLVHRIGGQSDTNKNTTQRILLLLEASPLGAGQGLEAYGRTVRSVLNRYLQGDLMWDHDPRCSRVPRFLLNDIVRYWRTICVDFAYKDWEQAGKKWAIRLVKLRTSRKLLFVAGLFMVFSCYRNKDFLRNGFATQEAYLLKYQQHLLAFVHSTPLNILVWTLQKLGCKSECTEFLSLYDQYLAKIDDESTRKHLEAPSKENIFEDAIFRECNEIGYNLQAILKKVFFEIDTPLQDFTLEYGVF